jgi:hypothetical protein
MTPQERNKKMAYASAKATVEEWNQHIALRKANRGK